MTRFLGFILLLICSQLKLIVCSPFRSCDSCLTAVSEILEESRKLKHLGQILASEEWFQFHFVSTTGFEVYNGIPMLVHGQTRNLSRNSSAKAHLRFTSSEFAHLHHSPSFKSIPTQEHHPNWKLLYLSVKRRISTRRAPETKVALNSMKNIIKNDLFIVTFDQIQVSETYFRQSFRLDYRHTIFISCLATSQSHQLTSLENDDFENVTKPIAYPISDVSCIYSTSRGLQLVQNVSQCRKSMHLKEFRKLGHSLSGRKSCNKSKIRNASCNMTNFYDDVPEEDISSLTRGKVDPLSRKGFLYSSLVFIAQKTPDNKTNVWGPFTIASWIGILAAYTVTAIVFGVIKIVTMNNLDNSWYDCILSQFMTFMNDEKVYSNQKTPAVVVSTPTISSSTIGVNVLELPDENENNHNCVTQTRRISVRSLSTVGDGNGNDDDQMSLMSGRSRRRRASSLIVDEKRNRQHRGKMSKAILYGTIRVVSFILLALYEGKLYNTITFPKSKLVASFDELLSNEKYSIKVSNEAAKYENISDKIVIKSRNLSLASNNRSAVAGGKVAESVNILDCVNWVESGSDPNHACVGYEFELRNLHKAQKSDKIFVKSKQRLLRFGSASAAHRFTRRRGFTLFPGGFQISKWILESGILQLWSIVENAFMESLINPNWSDPFKVFTIRDYLGLFVVYSLLLILASIMFCLEHTLTLGKKLVRNKKLRNRWRTVKKRGKQWWVQMRGKRRLQPSLRNKASSFFSLIVQTARTRLEKWRGRKYFRSLSSLNASKV